MDCCLEGVDDTFEMEYSVGMRGVEDEMLEISLLLVEVDIIQLFCHLRLQIIHGRNAGS